MRARNPPFHARIFHFQLKANHRFEHAHQRRKFRLGHNPCLLQFPQKIIARFDGRNTFRARLFFERENRRVISAERQFWKRREPRIQFDNLFCTKPRCVNHEHQQRFSADFFRKSRFLRCPRVFSGIQHQRKIPFVRQQRFYPCIFRKIDSRYNFRLSQRKRRKASRASALAFGFFCVHQKNKLHAAVNSANIAAKAIFFRSQTLIADFTHTRILSHEPSFFHRKICIFTHDCDCAKKM